jgi:hypothetical protein
MVELAATVVVKRKHSISRISEIVTINAYTRRILSEDRWSKLVGQKHVIFVTQCSMIEDILGRTIWPLHHSIVEAEPSAARDEWSRRMRQLPFGPK